MNINRKQIDFVQEVKDIQKIMEVLYGRIHAAVNIYSEQFASEKPHDLSTIENNQLECQGCISAVNMETAINQGLINFINFWNDHGKDLREIK
jgi:hypothetical protein